MSVRFTHKRKPIVTFVLCKDESRYRLWAERLLCVANVRLFVKDARGSFLMKPKNAHQFDFDEDVSCPEKVDLCLVHAGDSDLLDAVARSGRVFWFSTPGMFEAPEGDWPIRRPTSETDFDITVRDAEELVAFCLGERTALPRCCVSKPVAQFLPALSILCQGYLAAHADPLTGKPDLPEAHPAYRDCCQALHALNWLELVKQQSLELATLPTILCEESTRKALQAAVNEGYWWKDCAIAELVKGIHAEWGAPTGRGWAHVMELLDNIKQNQLSPTTVARAYLAVKQRLGSAAKILDIIPQWQQRRNEFSHIWLKKQYLLALGAWLNLLDGHVDDPEFERAFVPEVLAQWQWASQTAAELSGSFAQEMSPRNLFDAPPLAGCSAGTRQWLAPLLESLWRVHYQVDQLVADAKTRIAEADAAYTRLQDALRGEAEICSAVALRHLRPLFTEFRNGCQQVAKAIERFPTEVKVG